MRQQKNPPEDPMKFMTDFLGNYKDPMWDKMDEWREENELIKEKELPEMAVRIQELMNELAAEKRRTAAFNIYKTADAEETVSSKLI